MGDKNTLIEIWMYYKEHKPQYHDIMDDIEKRLQSLTKTSEFIWNRNLSLAYKNGMRSEFEKGNLPPNWNNLLTERNKT